jgi:hypothetical protein
VADVEAIATEIALIEAGSLVIITSPEDLLAQAQGAVWCGSYPKI